MPGLPLRLAPEISSLVELGIFDRPAQLVTSEQQQAVIETDKGKALLLPAKGEIIFALPPGARSLSFGFGLRPESYSGAAHTAGVGFGVDAVGASGQITRLGERFLSPLGQTRDRGTQRAEINLPAETVNRVVFHAETPLAKDSRWAESYFSALRFTLEGEPSTNPLGH